MAAAVYSIDDGPPYVLRRANLATGETTAELRLKAGPRSLALSVNEKHLAIASVGGTLIVATESFDQVTNLPTGATRCVTYSPEGKWLATGGDDKVLRLFASSTLTKGVEKCEHSSPIQALCFSPTSSKLVSAARDGVSLVWSMPALDVAFKLEGHTDAINSAIFVAMFVVATGSADGSIRFWDVKSGTSVKEKHGQWINAMALSPDGETFATGNSDKSISLFDAVTYDLIKTVKYQYVVSRLLFQDNDTLIVGVEKSRMIAFNIKDVKVGVSFGIHTEPNGIVIAGLGLYLAC